MVWTESRTLDDDGAAEHWYEKPKAQTDNNQQNWQRYVLSAASITAETEHSHDESTDLLSAILDRGNMLKAYDRVLKNKGAPGVDG